LCLFLPALVPFLAYPCAFSCQCLSHILPAFDVFLARPCFFSSLPLRLTVPAYDYVTTYNI
jgi:hypothetical protein